MDDVTLKTNELVDSILKEAEDIQKLVLPLYKEILGEMRSIRMAFSSEALNIVNAIRTTKDIKEYTEALSKLEKEILELQKTFNEKLTPDFKVKMQDLFR